MDAKTVGLAYTRIIGDMYAQNNIHTIAYGEAWEKAFPGEPWEWSAGSRWGPHKIELACHNLGWPQLNVLFVNEEGEPGKGYAKLDVPPYDWKEELDKAKTFTGFDEKILRDEIVKLE